MKQNLAIYPELDRIRRSHANVPTLVRICPYSTLPEIEADMLSLQRALVEQLDIDGEVMHLRMTNNGRRIYIEKVGE